MIRDEIVTQVYDELRRVAAGHLRREKSDHTLQPTALVHEAWLRLSELNQLRLEDRRDFLVAASGAIRRVLVDYARSRGAEKRGGGAARVTLSVIGGADDPTLDLLALDDAVAELTSLDQRKARVVELRYFGGLTIQETALALGVSTTTVEDDWAFARAWLRRRMEGAGGR